MPLDLRLSRSPLLHYLTLIAIFSVSHGPTTSSHTSQFFAAAASAPRKVPVGLVLDLSIDMVVGRTSRASIALAAEDFYAGPGRNYSTRIDFKLRDYNGDVFNATAAVVDLVKNDGVVAVIGPQRPSELSFVAELGTFTHVPIISFYSTATSLSRKYTPYFIRAANNDSTQAAVIASLAQAFGWRQLVPIYEDSEYGSGFVPLLVDALKEVADCRVPARTAISLRAEMDRVRVELLKLKAKQTRVFVVHASRGLAQKVFDAAAEEEVDMMRQGYAWIITETVTSLLRAVPEDLMLRSMQGVIGVRPYVPATPKLREFKSRWKKKFVQENPLDEHAYDSEHNTFVLWAYDTVFALAEAIELVYGSRGSGAAMSGVVPNVSRTAPPTNSELSSIPVSPAGDRLLNAILGTRIPNAVSGEFKFLDGELVVTAFEIINVNGRAPITVGYWTESRGLSRKLDLSTAAGNKTGKLAPTRNDLELIKWPGGTAATPKGWEQNPLEGKWLRVYVPGPTEPGFNAFLRSDRDNSTNVTFGVSGFVVDVFEAAVKQLPYAILWEYDTNRTQDGKSIGNYNQLVELVQNGTYDAIVGDVTITANRSEMVDFTLPYTASGVRMVVPKRDDSSSSLWIFLTPLTDRLWICIGIFFILTGMAIWMTEHRVNDDIRSGGSVFYFTFSTMVFAHGQKVISNSSRLLLVVWLFVVWILTSSYTASLTSMLTVNQVQPTVAEITDLLSTGEYIGYLENSFVKMKLLKMGFDEKRLRHYKSPQQYAEALALGSWNGGVGAVVDEIPYLKIFLKDYCSNYTITGKAISTTGFGFVFPHGSPLVADLNRAILNITEGGVLEEIERKWFGDESACAGNGSPFSSNSLDLANFGGLFIITFATSLGAFLCFSLKFLYGQRRVLIERDGSIIDKVRTLTKEFDRKKGDGNDGSLSLGGSKVRHRNLSHIHECTNCGSSRLFGGGGGEVGIESPISTIVDRSVLAAHGGDMTPSTHDRPTSPPSFSIISTPPRTSVDLSACATATPSMEMSPARFSTNTESSGPNDPEKNLASETL